MPGLPDRNPFNAFDGILVINRDIDLDRWVTFMEQAVKYGFADRVIRIPGVTSAVGSYGCAQAHIDALRYAKRLGWNNVLLFEDDAKFLYSEEKTHQLLKNVVAKLGDPDWDIIYLGMSMREKLFTTPPAEGTVFRAEGEWYGRFAMVVSSRCFDVYPPLPDLNNFRKEHRGDVYLNSRKDLRKYAVYPLPVSVTDAPSATDNMTNPGEFIESRYVRYGMAGKNTSATSGIKYYAPGVSGTCCSSNRVSVIIPAYKAVNFIEACLDSIASQNPFEMLVGVDGCPATLEKLVSIRHKYNSLKIYYSPENIGCYKIRNCLVHVSSGEHIIFFDADDIMLGTLVNTVSMKLAKHDVVRFRYVHFSGNDPSKTTGEVSPVYGCGVFGIRRAAMLGAGGFLPWKCSADYEFHQRLFKFYNYGRVDTPLFLRRIHQDSLTSSVFLGRDSELRKKYSEIIANMEQKTAYTPPVFSELSRVSDKKVTFNMATYPGGSRYLAETVDSILPVCDLLRVYLNEFTEVPACLKNRDKVVYMLGGADLGDSGKFYWAGEHKDEYYFTCDDDIRYSAEYVTKHITAIEKYAGEVLVTLHGRVVSPDKSWNIYDPKRVVLFRSFHKPNIGDVWCNIGGTGVMAFDNSKIKIDPAAFKYNNMADLYVARHAENRSLPILIREHSGKELTNLLVTKEDLSARIWDNRHKLISEHGEVEACMTWSVRTGSLKDNTFHDAGHPGGLTEDSVSDRVSTGRKQVTFNMATHPARIKSLERAVNSMLPFADRIRVYLNGYTEVPDFLKNNPIILYEIGGPDIRAKGKFFWAGKHRDEYYFSVDDDFLLTEEYVKGHLAALERYGNSVFVTSHALLLKPGAKTTLPKNRMVYHKCLEDQPEDDWATIGGTGVMCFDLSRFTVPAECIVNDRLIDIGVALHLRRNNIPLLVRKHLGSELIDIAGNDSSALWRTSKNVANEQEMLLKEFSDWDKPIVGELKL